jgi:hypothetical protein
MRVIVCGSRDFTDFSTVLFYLLNLREEVVEPVELTIVHGNAPGADSLAAKAADRCGYAVESHPAEKFGKWPACGPIRNRHMLSRGADLVLAFCIEGVPMKGTADMVSIALRAGVRVRTVFVARSGVAP